VSEFPTIPTPTFSSPRSLYQAAMALKQAVETLVGQRGNGQDRALRFSESQAFRDTQLTEFTLATLPLASSRPRHLVYVSDGASNQHVVVSDGAVWRYMDGTPV
jgi:hypothetical protein